MGAHAAELYDLWRHKLGLSLAVGAVAGATLVALVFSQAGTGHRGGGSDSRFLGVAWGRAEQHEQEPGHERHPGDSNEARIAAAHGVEVQLRDGSLLAASVVADLVALTAWAVMLLWGS